MSKHRTAATSLRPPEGEAIKRVDTPAQGMNRSARSWTEEEDAFVRRNWESMTHMEMGVALGRSKASILRRRVGALQLAKKTPSPIWTEEDNVVFRALYGKVDTGFLAGMLSRPISAMWAHAFCLKVQSRNAWTHEEDEILRAHFPIAPVSEFLELLPGRSKKNIYHRAEVLSLARDLPYLLGPWHMKFHGYPLKLRELIRLHSHVKRKLQDVQTQHRKPARPPIQSARNPR